MKWCLLKHGGNFTLPSGQRGIDHVPTMIQTSNTIASSNISCKTFLYLRFKRNVFKEHRPF